MATKSGFPSGSETIILPSRICVEYIFYLSIELGKDYSTTINPHEVNNISFIFSNGVPKTF
jgi:hypothetical protein